MIWVRVPYTVPNNIIRFIILILSVAVIILAYHYLSFIPIIMWIIIGIFSGLSIFVASVYLPFYFKSAGYYINSDKIIKKTGVFIKTTAPIIIINVF